MINIFLRRAVNMEFDLVENALHSLSEAISYYNEADEGDNEHLFKFSVILSNHCAELLLKEILRRNHPALVFENIDKINDIDNDDDIQTVGYRLALQRVKQLCHVNLEPYENYLVELGKYRNKIQHYKCKIDGAFYKNLMSQAFSAIEYLFLDILKLHFENYESILDPRDIAFLHEDTQAFKTRRSDILKEFQQGTAKRYKILYDIKKELIIPCPICGATLLAKEGQDGIRCKMCGKEFTNYQEICDNDQSCLTSNHILRELGKRKGKLYNPVYTCPKCDCNAVVYLPDFHGWKCLCCNEVFGDTVYCDDCGNPMPDGISQLAMSESDTEDYKYLCQSCTSKAKESDEYIGYYID